MKYATATVDRIAVPSILARSAAKSLRFTLKVQQCIDSMMCTAHHRLLVYMTLQNAHRQSAGKINVKAQFYFKIISEINYEFSVDCCV